MGQIKRLYGSRRRINDHDHVKTYTWPWYEHSFTWKEIDYFQVAGTFRHIFEKGKFHTLQYSMRTLIFACNTHLTRKSALSDPRYFSFNLIIKHLLPILCLERFGICCYMQFFTRRKPGSVWSKINKEKIQKLIDNGQIHQAGFDVIRLAKQNGSWTILDEVEALVVPDDLQKELIKKPNAKSYFDKLSRSDQKNLLQWLVLAKKAGTRLSRINEIVEFTNQNLKSLFKFRM